MKIRAKICRVFVIENANLLRAKGAGFVVIASIVATHSFSTFSLSLSLSLSTVDKVENDGVRYSQANGGKNGDTRACVLSIGNPSGIFRHGGTC